MYKVAHGHGWGLVTAAMHARWPCFIRVVCMEPTDGHTYLLTYTYTHTHMMQGGEGAGEGVAGRAQGGARGPFFPGLGRLVRLGWERGFERSEPMPLPPDGLAHANKNKRARLHTSQTKTTSGGRRSGRSGCGGASPTNSRPPPSRRCVQLAGFDRARWSMACGARRFVRLTHPLSYTCTWLAQITKTDKIKAMSKKQLRQVKKTQVRT